MAYLTKEIDQSVSYHRIVKQGFCEMQGNRQASDISGFLKNEDILKTNSTQFLTRNIDLTTLTIENIM